MKILTHFNRITSHIPNVTYHYIPFLNTTYIYYMMMKCCLSVAICHGYSAVCMGVRRMLIRRYHRSKCVFYIIMQRNKNY